METMTYPPLVWTRELSVNNDRLDSQHQELFKITNSLVDSEGIEVQSVEFAEILTRLTNYAHRHFEDEENYMKQIGYPGLAEHHKEHRDFSYKIAIFNVRTMERDQTLPLTLSAFLAEWWMNHLTVSDQAFRRYAGGLLI